MSDEIVDRIDMGTALKLLDGQRPMACCPNDHEPLICTMEFDGAEFFCVVCEGKFGFLSPRPKDWTQELQDRHDELKAVYVAARDARDLARYGESCDDEYEWAPVASVGDHTRAELRHESNGHSRPFLDGRWVTTTIYEKFQREWSGYYEAHPEEHEHPEGIYLCSTPECANYKDTDRNA